MAYVLIGIIAGACAGFGIYFLSRQFDSYVQEVRNPSHKLNYIDNKLTVRKMSLLSDVSISKCIVAFIVASFTYLFTGWVVLSATAFGIVFVGPQILKLGRQNDHLDKLSGLATWIEMLRDSLSASAGLVQAILTTVPLAPPSIRSELYDLKSAIIGGEPLKSCLFDLSNSFKCSVGDSICLALIAATEGSSSRLSELLSSLAAVTRQSVSNQLSIEASRESIRSSVKTVIWFSISFSVLLAVLGKSYMQPYSTFAGQFVLAIVICLYIGGIALLVSMAKTKEQSRLIFESAAEVM